MQLPDLIGIDGPDEPAPGGLGCFLAFGPCTHPLEGFVLLDPPAPYVPDGPLVADNLTPGVSRLVAGAKSDGKGDRHPSLVAFFHNRQSLLPGE